MARSLDRYIAEYEAQRARWAGGPAWLSSARERGLERFLALGFPTTRDEEWRFTNVSPIADQPFGLGVRGPSPVDVTPHRLPGPVAAEVVFVNGHYSSALSTVGVLPSGLRVQRLEVALTERPGDIEPLFARVAPPDPHAFTALNTAFAADGACIRIPSFGVLGGPIHLVFVSTRGPSDRAIMTHPRVLILAGDNSRGAVVESYVGIDNGRYFTNAVTEIVVGENAVLDHYKVQHEAFEGYHVGSVYVRTGRSAVFSSHSISLGGALVRNETSVVLEGEGAECTLNGLYFAANDRLVDNHTTIDHAKPHCGSREVYKGILADRARGVFNGKIVVRPDAQKTDARQTNRALLLSEDAQINTKPQLEIFANDVKCTHGAAVGQLDDEAVFYLRSRGLGEPDARRLLIHAFADDVLGRVPLESIRGRIARVLHGQLAQVLPAAA